MSTIDATRHDPGKNQDRLQNPSGDLKSVLQQVERDLILAALLESRGNKAQAARRLGITERLMGIRVKRLGIDWRSMRSRGQQPPAARRPTVPTKMTSLVT